MSILTLNQRAVFMKRNDSEMSSQEQDTGNYILIITSVLSLHQLLLG
jgi:hypothetical protein